MSDRGSYRAIKVVLIDGPDFQELSERANHVFLVLKLSLGPSGIEVHYPAALRAELSARTRIPADAVAKALDELEAAGWIRRERNVVWILGQLRHDPHMTWSDDKHRGSIWKHIAGLPRVPIVGAFVAEHPEWFQERQTTTSKGELKKLEAAPPEIQALVGLPPAHQKPQARPSGGPNKGLGRPIEAPITDNRVPITENEPENEELAGDKSPGVAAVVENSESEPLDDFDDEPDGPPEWTGDPAAQHAYFFPLLRMLKLSEQGAGSILLSWLKRGADPPSIERALRGLAALRDCGDLLKHFSIGKADVPSLKILNSKAANGGSEQWPIWRRAEKAYEDWCGSELSRLGGVLGAAS